VQSRSASVVLCVTQIHREIRVWKSAGIFNELLLICVASWGNSSFHVTVRAEAEGARGQVCLVLPAGMCTTDTSKTRGCQIKTWSDSPDHRLVHALCPFWSTSSWIVAGVRADSQNPQSTLCTYIHVTCPVSLWLFHLSHKPATAEYEEKLPLLKPASPQSSGASHLSWWGGLRPWCHSAEASTAMKLTVKNNNDFIATFKPQHALSSHLSAQTLVDQVFFRTFETPKFTSSFLQTEEMPDPIFSVEPQSVLSGKKSYLEERPAETPEAGTDTSAGMSAKLSLRSITVGLPAAAR